jgi:hypothetical protein
VNSITHTVLVATAALVVGGAGGLVLGGKINNARWEASFREFILITAANEMASNTNLLKGLRENKQDAVIDRLEMMLDAALIHVGYTYSPNQDPGGRVTRSIAIARDYRAKYPYASSRTGKVQAALAIKASSSESP